MDDNARVAALLGRQPGGPFTVVVRDDDGDPLVIANAPLLDDGTPMPTRYWLVGRHEVQAVSRLESAGGVRRAELAVDPDELADAHARYAAMRDALVPEGHTGPRPSGGVGGTRTGVKCLHAHYAWYLAGGDDPVGRWVAAQLGPPAVRLDLGASSSLVTVDDDEQIVLGVGVETLAQRYFDDHDPPAPEQLTNAIGEFADRFEEAVLARPEIAGATDVTLAGPHATAMAMVDVGTSDVTVPYPLRRESAEEVFRTLATEGRADRAHNPGLPPDMVDTIVAAGCMTVALMRRLHLDTVIVR